MSEFNEKEYLKEEIEPLVREIFAKLKAKDIPAYFSCCFANGSGGSEYFTELLSPDIANRNLCDDRFPKYVDINLGFHTVPYAPLEVEVDVSEEN